MKSLLSLRGRVEPSRRQPQLRGLAKESGLTWLTLFTTSGAMVCCAIPIVLVSLGMGATVASLVSSAPWLITLSENKQWVFAVSGLLITASGYLLYRPVASCPGDVELGQMCRNARHWNRLIHGMTVILWCLGFFAAFLLLPLQLWLEG